LSDITEVAVRGPGIATAKPAGAPPVPARRHAAGSSPAAGDLAQWAAALKRSAQQLDGESIPRSTGHFPRLTVRRPSEAAYPSAGPDVPAQVGQRLLPTAPGPTCQLVLPNTTESFEDDDTLIELNSPDTVFIARGGYEITIALATLRRFLSTLP
jgi:hypothetical protein